MIGQSDNPTPEALFAENMKSLREHLGWSQSDMASRMADLGFSWHPATVYSIEKGERKIPLNEAAAIARIMRSSMDVMTRPSEVVSMQMAWDLHWERFKVAAQRLLQAAEAYERARSFVVNWVEAFKAEYKISSPGQRNLYDRVTKYSAVDLISPGMDEEDKRTIAELLSNREAANLEAEGDGEHPEAT